MDLREAAQHCRQGNELPADRIPGIVESLLDDGLAHDEKAEFLKALADKGESSAEVSAFAEAILPRALPAGVTGHHDGKRLFDCCGTGGGGLNIVNISTGIIFILAACGIPVVKHGNKGVTKKSGSADVLQALGIRLAPDGATARRELETVGATFLFAPSFHPAFKAIAPARQQLAAEGRRSVFNYLGPLLNPARPASQMTGIFKPETACLFDEALSRLGRERHLIVTGQDGKGTQLGEASSIGPTQFLGHFGDEPVSVNVEHPAAAAAELAVSSTEESAQKLVGALQSNEDSVLCQMLVLNAGAALWVQGETSDLEAGRAMAGEALRSRRAYEKLVQWQDFSA